MWVCVGVCAEAPLQVQHFNIFACMGVCVCVQRDASASATPQHICLCMPLCQPYVLDHRPHLQQPNSVGYISPCTSPPTAKFSGLYQPLHFASNSQTQWAKLAPALHLQQPNSVFHISPCTSPPTANLSGLYIRFIYGIFGREITKYTVMYSVHTRFWPTLRTSNMHWRFAPRRKMRSYSL